MPATLTSAALDPATAILTRLPLHRLTGTEPLAMTREAGDPFRPAATYHPTLAAARLLMAAQVVFAEDVGDPTKYAVCKGADCLLAHRGPDPLLVTVVQLDLDSDEYVWLLGVLRWLDTSPFFNGSPK